jgi:hypothetical protein
MQNKIAFFKAQGDDTPLISVCQEKCVKKRLAQWWAPETSSRVESLLTMMGQRECRGDVDMPLPGMKGHPKP